MKKLQIKKKHNLSCSSLNYTRIRKRKALHLYHISKINSVKLNVDMS